jgi:hypothetical protein
MNAANLAFSVHDGDIGADPDDCNDIYLKQAREHLDTFRAPLVYTPGGNRWIDCRDKGFRPLRPAGGAAPGVLRHRPFPRLPDPHRRPAAA